MQSHGSLKSQSHKNLTPTQGKAGESTKAGTDRPMRDDPLARLIHAPIDSSPQVAHELEPQDGDVGLTGPCHRGD